MRDMRYFLNGFAESGCHQSACFSTYHHIEDGRCSWCGRTEIALIELGAEWIDVLGNKRPVPRQEPT